MVDYTLSTDEAFVTAFKQGVTTLTDSSSTSRGKGEIRQESQHPPLAGLGENTLHPQLASQSRSSAGRPANSSTVSKVCIGDSLAPSSRAPQLNDQVMGYGYTCFPLPPADYQAQFPDSPFHPRPEDPALLSDFMSLCLLVDVVDERGGSLLKGRAIPIFAPELAGIDRGQTLRANR